MSDNDPDCKPVNPYAPPLAAADVERSKPVSELFLDVELSGRPTDNELRSCLAAEQGISLQGFVGLMFFFVSPMALIAINERLVALGAVIAGFGGFMAIVYCVSGVRYRAGVFKNTFPDWDSVDAGKSSTDGITLFLGDSWMFYRWDWFSHAVMGRLAILLAPKLRTKCPVVIGQNMLVCDVPANAVDDWERFSKSSSEVLETTQTSSNSKREEVDQTQGGAVAQLMCDRNRSRTISCEAGAVNFSGDISTQDLVRASTGDVELKRTRRSRIVIGLLLSCGALIAGGLSDLVLGAFWILLGFYVMVIVAWNLRAMTTRVSAPQRRHYFLLGYATVDRVVIDMGITVASYAWADMRILALADDLVALKAERIGQAVVLRPDMFASQQQWNSVVALAQRNG